MRFPGRAVLGRQWRAMRQWPEQACGALAARGWLPPYGAPSHHPVFAAFPPPSVVGDGVDTDWLGLRTQAEMLPPYWRSPAGGALPEFDEEYFEWLDVLEAVDAAARAGAARFAMLEVGAGYARWAARGWAAARARGMAAQVGVVEAEPQHLAWARSHLSFNGVPDGDVTFFDSAVGAAAGETVFLVEMPAGSDGNSPREWYGQAVAWSDPASGAATARQYFGRELVAMPGGWMGVPVKVARLSEMLAGLGRLDLVDFDIQGAETEVIREAIRPLSAQVRRLHIGTHSRQIDAELPRILGAAGWRCLRAYPCLRWNRTEYGWIRFNDGVQSWVNPALTDG